MAELRFAAMGTWAHVIVNGGPAADLCEQARRRIDDLERKWSRFLPDSEISRMNAARPAWPERNGRPSAVSAETAALLARASEASRLTGGRFDASVLAAVVGAGYDRAMGIATLPAATGFDPGGIGKGFAADVVVGELLTAGAAGACVNLGGDLRAEGTPGLLPWIVDVEDPFGGPPLDGWSDSRSALRAQAADLPLTRSDALRHGRQRGCRPPHEGFPTSHLVRIGLNRGGVATSSRLRRAWAGGHHLIDPRTGEPAVTDAVAATVIAGTAWRAEAVATAAVVAGIDEGVALIESCGLTGLVVGDDGVPHHAAGLGRFLG